MVIKITQAKTSRGMVEYNDKKVKAGQGSVLGFNKLATDGVEIEKIAGKDLSAQLELRSALNGGTGKKFIHISINPNPDEKLTDEKMTAITKDYMKQIGYASQPYIIYKHNDIDREHIHVVACSIKPDGKLMSDSNLFYKSNAIRKELEEKYDLMKGDSQKLPERETLKGLDYKKSFSSGQIKSIGLGTLDRVKFSDFKGYAAYMQSLDVSVKQAKTKEGKVLGLTYQPMEGGSLQGVPIKASRLDPRGRMGMAALERGFKKNGPSIEAGLGEFQARLGGALSASKGEGEKVANLKEESIKPIFAGEAVLGFVDLKANYFHRVEDLDPAIKNDLGDLKPEPESVQVEEAQKGEVEQDPIPAQEQEQSSKSGNASSVDLRGEKEGAEESGAAGDLIDSLTNALSQMGGDSTSPENDKELKKKQRKKRGI